MPKILPMYLDGEEIDGFSTLAGRLDIKTGRVTFRGRVFTRSEWVRFTQGALMDSHRKACAQRDLTSDVQNLPGVKPRFRDTWFGVVPEIVPPPYE